MVGREVDYFSCRFNWRLRVCHAGDESDTGRQAQECSQTGPTLPLLSPANFPHNYSADLHQEIIRNGL